MQSSECRSGNQEKFENATNCKYCPEIVQAFGENFCSGFREHYPEPRHRLQPPRPLPNLSSGPSCLVQVNILVIFLFLSYSGKISSFTFISCEYLLKSDKIVSLSQSVFTFTFSFQCCQVNLGLIWLRKDRILPESIYEWQQDLNCTAESLKPWRISNHRPRKMWAPEEKNSNILEEGILILIDKHKRARPRTHS